MRAWQLSESNTAPPLVMHDIAQPQPGPGDVLIRVQAAGVTPSELQWYPTTHTPPGEPRRLAVPGHEFAGTVHAVGEQVTGFSVDQRVYGMNDWFADGATAEFCITQSDKIAPAPANLTPDQAAAVPIGALTAQQGLFDRAKLQRGETVLIHGGSGAVGVFAVQLAARAGARVVTTASARNRDFLIGLGAERVVDYHHERFEDQVAMANVIFDTVGGDTLARSWSLLAPEPAGRMITIASDSEGTTDDRTKAAFFIVEPNVQQLTDIAAMLDAGELQVFTDAVVDFNHAADAYANRAANKAGRGKVVIHVAD